MWLVVCACLCLCDCVWFLFLEMRSCVRLCVICAMLYELLLCVCVSVCLCGGCLCYAVVRFVIYV